MSRSKCFSSRSVSALLRKVCAGRIILFVDFRRVRLPWSRNDCVTGNKSNVFQRVGNVCLSAFLRRLVDSLGTADCPEAVGKHRRADTSSVSAAPSHLPLKGKVFFARRKQEAFPLMGSCQRGLTDEVAQVLLETCRAGGRQAPTGMRTPVWLLLRKSCSKAGAKSVP